MKLENKLYAGIGLMAFALPSFAQTVDVTEALAWMAAGVVAVTAIGSSKTVIAGVKAAFGWATSALIR